VRSREEGAVTTHGDDEIGTDGIAIRGYDPVAYFTMQRPTPGLAEIEFEWDDRRYRFANALHRDAFRADPTRYAPQFNSFCAMALSRGEVLDADPEYWLVSNGRLYLFGKPVGPTLFRSSLVDHRESAERNRSLIRQR